MWWLGVPLWALLLMLPHGTLSFFPNFWSRAMAAAWGSVTHQDLTEDALLNVTLELLRDLPRPRTPLTLHPQSQQDALAEVAQANAAMDFMVPARDDPVLHFDAEQLRSAGAQLFRARTEVLQALGAELYPQARRCLGQLLHSLQDFYSHSNWVELGHRDIHPHLLQPGRELGNIAGADVPTCRSCPGWTCEGNILASVREHGLLTSGYFGTEREKLPGKCSHGGPFDGSRLQEPQGGINKDSSSPIFSPHHQLHGTASALALEASVVFLRELRRDLAHDKRFMRLLDVSPTTGLSFVLDTTGSMGEEIGAARLQAREIISRRLGSIEEPDYYLLVPFHDPGFGPVHKTSDASEFLKILDSISPLAGGDEPEMCLSALQLALLHSPPMSEIFVFTDASAKDAHLRSSVEALIQERRCKVTFLITEDPSRTRVKREVLAPDRFDLYVDLARSSGGQVIFTDNANIRQVAGIIGETTASSVGRRDPTHHFWIDSRVDTVVVTIQGDGGQRRPHPTTGRGKTCVPPPVGRWTVEVSAPGNYSVHVRGEEMVKPRQEWGERHWLQGGGLDSLWEWRMGHWVPLLMGHPSVPRQ
uniref:von Willebrand factor A domain containing 7 n=1 Tax=Pelusios castaneus TaxID=367368 RepID=A0A8C8VFL1_9SAUR